MLITASLPVNKRLTLTNQRTGELVYIRNLRYTPEFKLSYIHSANKTPVTDYFRVNENDFTVYKTTFSSYGAGMPDYDGEGIFELSNGRVTISNMNKTLSDFSVFIGTIASHKLIFDDSEFFLADTAPPQSLIKFEIKRVSLFEIMYVELKGR